MVSARDEELREIGRKTVLLIEELVAVFARSDAKGKRDPRHASGGVLGESESALSKSPLRSPSPMGSPFPPGSEGETAAPYAALQKQVEHLDQRLAALEQRLAPLLDARALPVSPPHSPGPVPQGGGDDADVAAAASVSLDTPSPSSPQDASAGPSADPAADAAADSPKPPARLARSQSRRLALKAARSLHQQGKPVTLAAVAREAGLKYSQVVYAFRRRRDLMDALKAEKAQ